MLINLTRVLPTTHTGLNGSNRRLNAHASKVHDIIINIKNKGLSRLEPSFEPGLGIIYKELEEYDFETLRDIFELLEQAAILANRGIFDTIMKCKYCSSYRLTLRLICTACRSADINRGTVIEHLSCGNIDFDESYLTKDGQLLCKKCRKRLNAVGVDYSKPGYFYKCKTCFATLPNIETLYKCLECGKPSTQDELEVTQLSSYNIDLEKLSSFLEEEHSSHLLAPLISTLNKIGIKAVLFGEVIGASKTKHTFELIVYDDDKGCAPMLVADIIDKTQIQNNNASISNQKDHDDERIIAFYARCADISSKELENSKDTAKILIAIPNLSQDARILADTYGIKLIESQTREEAISKLVQTILKTYTESKKSGFQQRSRQQKQFNNNFTNKNNSNYLE